VVFDQIQNITYNVINETTAGAQSPPVTTVLDDGRVLHVYSNNATSDSDVDQEVFGRIFHANGVAATGEFQIGSVRVEGFDGFDVPNMAIENLSDGRVAITHSRHTDEGPHVPILNVIDTSFTPGTLGFVVAEDVIINDLNDGNPAVGVSPAVLEVLADGRLLAIWNGLGSTNDNAGQTVFGRFFDNQGDPVSDQFQIGVLNVEGSDNQDVPYLSATQLANGNVVVAYVQDNTGLAGGLSTGSTEAIVSVLNVAEEPGTPEFEVIADLNVAENNLANNQSTPFIEALPDGRFFALWTDFAFTEASASAVLQGRFFNADGTANSDQFQVGTFATLGYNALDVDNFGLETLPNGNLLIHGVRQDGLALNQDPFYTIIDPTVEQGGDGFVVVQDEYFQEVNTTYSDSPAVITTTDDGFFAVWAQNTENNSAVTNVGVDGNLVGRYFDSNGVPLGNVIDISHGRAGFFVDGTGSLDVPSLNVQYLGEDRGVLVSYAGNNVSTLAGVVTEPVVNPSNGSEISGIGIPGATIEIDTTGDGVVDEEVVVAANGTFSVTFDPALDNATDVSITQINFIGNQSNTVVETVDSLPPNTPVITALGIHAISGTAEPGSRLDIDINDDDSIDVSITVDESGNWTHTFDPQVVQGTDISVSATDDVGNESIATVQTVDTDPDLDQVDNVFDLDDDNDGILDTVELLAAGGVADIDGDGLINSLDLDSDNDGINDVIEAGASDTNLDGRADGIINADGVVGSVNGGVTPIDSDGDSIADAYELDSDDDGVFDIVGTANEGADVEAGGDGQIDDTTDDDLDGIADVADDRLGEFFDNSESPEGPQQVAFVHGDDSGTNSDIGLSYWISNGDGTFSTNQISVTGFDRDGVGSEVFGQNSGNQTYFTDANNDGHTDVVHFTEDGGNSVFTYLNNGDGTFETDAIVTTGFDSTSSGVFSGTTSTEQGIVADVNADGNIDYIQIGNNNDVNVFVGNGDGTFETSHLTTTIAGSIGTPSGFSTAEDTFIQDINNDGVADLVRSVASGSSSQLQIWRGVGDGTFEINPFFSELLADTGGSNSGGSGNEEFTELADVNNDGFLDYVHAETADSTSQIHAFLNNGDGTFNLTQVTSNITNTPLANSGIFANLNVAEQSFLVDVTEDGIVDFVATFDNQGVNSGIAVYEGNGDGTFTDNPTLTALDNFNTGIGATESSGFFALNVVPTAPTGQSEVQVNATVTGAQSAPVTTLLADGRILHVYHDEAFTEDSVANDLYGRIFNSDGSPSTPEFQIGSIAVNGEDDYDAASIVVTQLTTGEVAIGYLSNESEDAAINNQPYLQIINPAIAPGQPGFQVAENLALVDGTAANDQSPPAITALEDGRIFSIWVNNGDGNNSSLMTIQARITNADGTHDTPQFQIGNAFVEGNNANDIDHYTVSQLADGNVVIGFIQDQTSNGNNGTRPLISIVDPTAMPGTGAFNIVTDFVIQQTDSTSDESAPIIQPMADGRFLAVWYNNAFTDNGTSNDVQGRIFNADGTPDGAQFQIGTVGVDGSNNYDVPNIDVAELSDGNLVVSFVRNTSEGGDEPIINIFNPDIAPGLAGFEIITDLEVQQYDVTTLESSPIIVATPNGGFAAVWQRNGEIRGELRGRYFDADGNAITDEFSINHTVPGVANGFEVEDGGTSQVLDLPTFNVVLADTTSNNIVVSWQGGAAGPLVDGSSSAVLSEVIEFAQVQNMTTVVVNETTAGAQSPPITTVLDDGRVLHVYTTNATNDADTNLNLFGRIFHPNNIAATSEFQIGTLAVDGSDAYDVPNVDVQQFADGRIAVGFISNSSETLSDEPILQVFDPSFNPGELGFVLAEDVLITQEASTTLQSPPVMLVLEDGRLLAVWVNDGASNNDTAMLIQGRLFNNEGDPLSDQFQIGETIVEGSDALDIPHINLEQLANGNVVVGFVQDDIDTPIGGAQPTITVLDFALEPGDLGFEIVSDFVVTENAANISSSTPLITALPDGRFIAVWLENAFTDNNVAMLLQGRFFDADGTPAGDRFQIGDLPIDGIDGFDVDNFSVETLSNGNLLVHGVQNSSAVNPITNNQDPIYTIIDPTELPTSDNFVVIQDQFFTEFNTSFHDGPVVVTATDDGFFAVWSQNTTTSSTATSVEDNGNLVGRYFDNNGVPTSNNIDISHGRAGFEVDENTAFDVPNVNVQYLGEGRGVLVSYVGNNGSPADGNGTGTLSTLVLPNGVVLDPIVNPSNGTEVTGLGIPNSTIELLTIDTGGAFAELINVDANGEWSRSFSSQLEDGATIRATQFGVSNAQSNPVTVTVDAVAPDIPIITLVSTIEIAGTAEAGSQVNIDFTGDGTADVIVRADADGNFAHTFDFELVNGTTVSVTATDAVGNESEASAETIATDPDGDGINNDVDFDDDNDGILDVMEERANVVQNAGFSINTDETIVNATSAALFPGWTVTSTDLNAGDGVLNEGDGFFTTQDGGTTSLSQTVSGVDTENPVLLFEFFWRDGNDNPAIGEQIVLTVSYAGVDYVRIETTELNDIGTASVTYLNDATGPITQVVNSEAALLPITLPTVPATGDLVFSGVMGANNADDFRIDNVYLSSDVVFDQDIDGDGLINSLDLDSDNDGINDVIEAGNRDSNGDGIADGVANADGIVGSVISGVVANDTDGDGIIDAFEVDSDDDGTNDIVGTINEALDTNGDGRINNIADADDDGIADVTDERLGAFGDDPDFVPAPQQQAYVQGRDDTGGAGDGLSIWQSNGDGTFSETQLSFTGFDRAENGTEVFGNDSTSQSFFVDVDGDGDTDILHATDTGGSAIYTYLNNNDGTFSTEAIASTVNIAGVNGGIGGLSATEQGFVADVNADGYADYIKSGNDNQIHVYLNNGDGSFEADRITTVVTETISRLTSGIDGGEFTDIRDVNNDGVADLVHTADLGADSELTVLLGIGDGTFQTTAHFQDSLVGANGTDPSGSDGDEYNQLADVNNDGFLDYIHAESFSSSADITVYLNNGDGTFQLTAVDTNITNVPDGNLALFASFDSAGQSFFVDVTEDGIIDYVTTYDDAAVNDGITVYEGLGEGSFSNNSITTVLDDFAAGVSNVGTSGFFNFNVTPLAPTGQSQTQVNVTFASAESPPISTLLPDGRILHVYHYQGTTDNSADNDLFGRIFNADGSPSTPEFTIGTIAVDGFDGYDVDNFTVEVLENGYVAIGHISNSSEVLSDEPILNIIDPTIIPGQVGFAVASDILITENTSTTVQSPPVLTALDDGRVLAVWTVNGASNSNGVDGPIQGRIFNADGSADTAQFQIGLDGVDGFDGFDVDNFTVSQLQNGNVVIGFVQGFDNGVAINEEPAISIIDPSQTPGTGTFAVLSDFQVQQTDTTTVESPPVIQAMADGRFIAVWHNNGSSDNGTTLTLRARIFDADGSNPTQQFQIGSLSVDGFDGFDVPNFNITELSDGNLVVGFVRNSSNDGGDEPIFSIIDPSVEIGTLGFEVAADVEIQQFDVTGVESPPVIVATPNGGFAAVWQRNGTVNGELRGRYFDADGEPITDEFSINHTVQGVVNGFQVEDTDAFDVPNFNVILADNVTNNIVVSYAGEATTPVDGSSVSVLSETIIFEDIQNVDIQVVNETTVGNQSPPVTLVMADGRILYVYNSDALNDDDNDMLLLGRIYNADNTPATDEFQIGTVPLEGSDGFDVPHIALEQFDNGNVAITHISSSSSNSAEPLEPFINVIDPSIVPGEKMFVSPSLLHRLHNHQL